MYLGAMRQYEYQPCIPTRGTFVPAGTDWLHEIKHDGYRLIVQRDGQRVRLFTRRGSDWPDRFPLIVEAALQNKQQHFLYPQIFRGRLAPVFLLFVAHLDALIEGAQAGLLNSRDVHKYVFAAAVGLDKAISLVGVEPLHCTNRHVLSPFDHTQHPKSAAL